MAIAATSPPRAPGWSIAGLAVVLIFACWWRGHTFAPTIRDALGIAPWPVVKGQTEPLDCDEAAYAYMARRMLEGDRLYADLSENKPPLGYRIYAAAVALGGPDELAVRLLPIPLVLGTIALVWWIALRLGGPASACLAALLYAILSCDPYTYGNGAQLEQAINLFAVGSLAAMLAACSAGPRWRVPWLVIAGISIGLATLVKQVAAAHLAVLLLASLVMPGHPRGDGPERLRGRLRAAGGLVLGFALVWLLTVGDLASRGTAGAAFDDIIRHGRAMATDVLPEPNAPPVSIRWLTGNADPQGDLPPPFGSTDYLVWWGRGTWPIWLAAVPCLAWLAAGPTSFGRGLLVAWTASAIAQVVAPGLYWPHYYLLPMPGLAIASAVTLGALVDRSRLKRAWPLALLLAGAMGGTIYLQVRDYLLVPAEELTARHKGGRQWIALRGMGRTLAGRVDGWDDPTLLVWGWQSPLYYYGRIDAPSRHFFTNNLMRDHSAGDHPVVGPRIDELMADLERERPEFLFLAYPPFPRLDAFARSHYLPSTTFRGLWVRADRWSEFEDRPRGLRRSAPIVGPTGPGSPGNAPGASP